MADGRLDAASQRSTAGRVQGLVQLANDRMRSNRLTGATDSAQSYLLSARKLDPANPAVQEGLSSLSKKLQAGAQRALNEGRLDDAVAKSDDVLKEFAATYK